MKLSDVFLRLKAIVLRPLVEKELQEEMEFHIEMETRENLLSGMTPEEARRQAVRKFGVPSRIAEECRDQRRIGLWDTLSQDVQYALRGFLRAPAFVAAVTGTIGLGLGINAAVFTVFNVYVLRPFPVRDSASLYEVSSSADNLLKAWGGFSWDEYQDFPKDRPFSQVFAYSLIQTRVDSRALRGQGVTGDYFQILDVHPYLGRVLMPEDAATPRAGAVIVLSYQAWQSRLRKRSEHYRSSKHPSADKTCELLELPARGF